MIIRLIICGLYVMVLSTAPFRFFNPQTTRLTYFLYVGMLSAALWLSFKTVIQEEISNGVLSPRVIFLKVFSTVLLIFGLILVFVLYSMRNFVTIE